MRFTADSAELGVKLQVAARVASTRLSSGVVGGVLVKAVGNNVTLAATDLEISVTLSMKASVEAEGQALVPGRLFLDVVRMAGDASVTCEATEREEALTVRSGKNQARLQLLRSEDFPPLPAAAGNGGLALPGEELGATVMRVSKAVSRDETRPLLTGVLVSAGGQRARLVATDSYRLAVAELALQSVCNNHVDVVVPARALSEVSRLVAHNGNVEVNMSVVTNQVVFSVDGVVLSSRVIDGQFPHYEQLLPDSADYELRFETEELLTALRRVSLVAQGNTPVSLEFREGEVTVRASTPDVGDANEALPVDFHGEPLDIGFNPVFLRDGLEIVGSKEMVLKLISPLRPVVVEAVVDDKSPHGAFSYLVMPVRLSP